jgi:hypothetical protein
MAARGLTRLLAFVAVLGTVLVLGAGVALAGDTFTLDEEFCTAGIGGSVNGFIMGGAWDNATMTCTGEWGQVTDEAALVIPIGTSLVIASDFAVVSDAGVINNGNMYMGSELSFFTGSKFENHGSVIVVERLGMGGSVSTCCGSVDNYGSITTSGEVTNPGDAFVNRCGSYFSAGEVLGFPTIEEPCPWPLAMVDTTSGVWHLRVLGAVDSFYFGNPGDVPFLGDWDCDGVDTPGLFRQSDAFAYLRNTNSQGIADIRFFFGNPSDIPLAGDFNGDGCDSLSIYRPSEARFYIVNKLGQDEGRLGPADYSFLFGNVGDKPVVGDWDGDGIDEIGLHRESTGFFYWRNTLDTGIADGEMFFGDPGDRFVAGDWGVVDGVDTPGVFRPSNTTFYLRHTLSEGNADSKIVFGDSDWLPVAGTFGL